MELHYGHGGWVRVTDDALPGDLYLRLAPDERGRWRTADFYLHGAWRPVVAADLRELDLSGIEEAILGDLDVLEREAGIHGPDLETLAASFATSYGSGVYGGRHCEECAAPLRGVSARTPERWSGDWVALSWFAQYDGNPIRRPKIEPTDRHHWAPGAVPRLQRPVGGLTDEFLEHVASAYRQAVLEGKHPAPELARQVGSGTSARTIHKWVSIARQRGIMPPASRQGRAG